MTNFLPTVNTSALTLTFDDEFNTFVSSPDGSVGWMTEYPFYGSERTLADTDEAEYNSDSSVGVNPFSDSNGILTITATPATGASANPLDLPYNSGVITTYKSFAQLYGYFEISAELPAGQGLWPAFWMMPVDGQSGTELDIFEVLGNAPNILNATTHSGVTGSVSQAIAVANTSAGFHTYGVDWGPSTITFYMDGQAIAQAATPPDMDVPMYMIVSLAVGGQGSWPGTPNASTQFPASLQINYVRAYATADTVGTSDPSPEPTPAALPAVQSAPATGTSWLGVTLYNWDFNTAQAGVGVALLNATGKIIATGVTNSAGSYVFSALAAGTYQIKYILPSNLVFQAGSQANLTTGLTATVNLASGTGTFLTHQSVLSLAQLAGTVDLGSTGVAGLTVKLLDSNQNVIATTTTDATGRFNFDVSAGTYHVQYTPAAGTVLQTGGHANPQTGISPPITLTIGEAFLLTPEVLVSQSATVNGSVMLATSTGASGDGGVAVSLLASDGSTMARTTTNSAGAFSFSGLAAGTYQLAYTAPTNQVLAAGSAANTTTGLTAAMNVAAGQTVTATTQMLAPLFTVNGNVMLLANGSTAPVPEIVTVSLRNASGAVVAATRTNNAGTWSFAGLSAGAYQVSFTLPSWQSVQSGPATTISSNTASTGALTLGASQTVNVGTETLLLQPTTITGGIVHYGEGDPNTGQGGVVISLLNATSGKVVATTTTAGNGSFSFTNLTAGTAYQVSYAAPSWEVFQARTGDVSPGLTQPVTLAAGQQFTMTHETLLSTSNIFTEIGSNAAAVRGAGNYTVAGNATNSTLTLGNGNQSVTLPGSGNTITVGTGNSSILAGANTAVHAGGGLIDTTTIIADGGGDTLDVASGTVFLQADGSAGNTFMLNAKGQGLVTVSGFNTSTTDVLNLSRTLVGINVGSSLQNLGLYVTSATANGNTTLLVDPTGGHGTATAFAVLDSVSTTVAQLVSGHHIVG